MDKIRQILFLISLLVILSFSAFADECEVCESDGNGGFVCRNVCGYCTPTGDTTPPNMASIQVNPSTIPANSYTIITTNANDPESGLWNRCTLELLFPDGRVVLPSGDNGGPKYFKDTSFDYRKCQGKLYFQDGSPLNNYGHGSYILKITVYNGDGNACEHLSTTKQVNLIYVDQNSCTDADGDLVTNCAGDCNDNNPNIYPGAPEICNNIDDNCNLQVDEGIIGPLCENQKGVCAGSRKVCVNGQFLPCSSVNYGPLYANPENQCDGLDNDCDGLVDENIVASCQTSNYLPVNGCQYGLKTCTLGTWGACIGEIGPSPANNYCGYSNSSNITGAPNITAINYPKTTMNISYFVPNISVVNAVACSYQLLGKTYTMVKQGDFCIGDGINLKNGNYQIKFIVQGAQNSTNTTRTFVVSDKTAPKINIISPADGSTLSSNSFTLQVSTDEPADVVFSFMNESNQSLYLNATSGSVNLNKQNGNYQLIIYAKDYNNNIAQKTLSFSVNYTSSSGSGSSGSGGGGGGGSSGGSGGGGGGSSGGSGAGAIAQSDQTTKYFDKIVDNADNTWVINNSQIPVSKLTFTSNENISKVDITIKKGKSVAQDYAGKVYEYFTISHPKIDDKNIKSAAIKFRVNQSFLAENNATKEDILLAHYNEQKSYWEKLPTNYDSSDSSYFYYNALSPGFSEFAIILKEEDKVNKNINTQNPTENNKNEIKIIQTKQANPEKNEIPSSTEQNQKGKQSLNIALGVGIMILIVVAGLFTYLAVSRAFRPNFEDSEKEKTKKSAVRSTIKPDIPSVKIKESSQRKSPFSFHKSEDSFNKKLKELEMDNKRIEAMLREIEKDLR